MKHYQFELEKRILERTAKLQTKVEQHKRAEEALRENDAVLQSMLNATPVGVGLLVNRQFKKVNNSLCDITGYTETELTGQNTRILYADDAEYLRIDQELYKSGIGRRVGMMASRMQRKDGSIIDVILNLSPFDPENPDSGVTVTIMDVSDRMRAEEALKRANMQVALLTSITRHDILNKMTALRGYINYMKKQKTDEAFAEIIAKEESLTRQIANLINFTRDYKDVGVQPPCWIGVAEMITTLQRSMDLGPVYLHMDTKDFEIFADPLIKKVFGNLIDNSLRHGGPVTEIRITASEQENYLIILYEDNGRGIPPDEKEMIFDRESGKNTGLGLFLAREILAITGITIIETGVAGVRFRISVPKRFYRYSDIRQHSF